MAIKGAICGHAELAPVKHVALASMEEPSLRVTRTLRGSKRLRVDYPCRSKRQGVTPTTLA